MEKFGQWGATKKILQQHDKYPEICSEGAAIRKRCNEEALDLNFEERPGWVKAAGWLVTRTPEAVPVDVAGRQQERTRGSSRSFYFTRRVPTILFFRRLWEFKAKVPMRSMQGLRGPRTLGFLQNAVNRAFRFFQWYFFHILLDLSYSSAPPFLRLGIPFDSAGSQTRLSAPRSQPTPRVFQGASYNTVSLGSPGLVSCKHSPSRIATIGFGTLCGFTYPDSGPFLRGLTIVCRDPGVALAAHFYSVSDPSLKRSRCESLQQPCSRDVREAESSVNVYIPLVSIKRASNLVNLESLARADEAAAISPDPALASPLTAFDAERGAGRRAVLAAPALVRMRGRVRIEGWIAAMGTDRAVYCERERANEVVSARVRMRGRGNENGEHGVHGQRGALPFKVRGRWRSGKMRAHGWAARRRGWARALRASMGGAWSTRRADAWGPGRRKDGGDAGAPHLAGWSGGGFLRLGEGRRACAEDAWELAVRVGGGAPIRLRVLGGDAVAAYGVRTCRAAGWVCSGDSGAWRTRTLNVRHRGSEDGAQPTGMHGWGSVWRLAAPRGGCGVEDEDGRVRRRVRSLGGVRAGTAHRELTVLVHAQDILYTAVGGVIGTAARYIPGVRRVAAQRAAYRSPEADAHLHPQRQVKTCQIHRRRRRHDGNGWVIAHMLAEGTRRQGRRVEGSEGGATNGMQRRERSRRLGSEPERLFRCPVTVH
ncbi:hypothetical protein DFH09DRAFT_1281187 [Mycena vulgaris]|nr:hypothetical protein DFH09DRAFT_1281187 [Mycena vulgaris]